MKLEDIKILIEKSVPQAIVFVLDPMNDGQHLQAVVISPAFEGMMLVKQHQMVMKPLKEAFATSVHAMGLRTFTPAQWDEVKDKFNLG